MRGWAALICAGAALACSGPLPSHKPLGQGALAKAEAQRRAEYAKHGGEADAGADSGTTDKSQATADSKSPKPQAKDAGAAATASAAGEDAGAASAQEDAGLDAKKPGAATWAGLYVGSDQSLFQIEGLPDNDMKDPNAKTRVKDRSDGGVDLTAVDSSNGQDICTLKAAPVTSARTSFKIVAGQHCFDNAQSGTVGTVTSGSAKFSGKRLVLKMKLDIEIKNPAMTRSGTLDYSFEGTRN